MDMKRPTDTHFGAVPDFLALGQQKGDVAPESAEVRGPPPTAGIHRLPGQGLAVVEEAEAGYDLEGEVRLSYGVMTSVALGCSSCFGWWWW